MYEFDCPQPVTVAVRLGGGGVDVLAEERHTAQVDVAPVENNGPAAEAAANTVVELRGDTLIVEAPNSTGGWLFRRSPRLRVTIRVPLDSALALKVASADVRCRGRYSGGQVSTASGDVHVDEVTGDVEVNTASGSANLDRAGGHVKANTASGDVRVGYTGRDVVMHSASGNLELGRADASVRATTASGDIRVGAASHGTVRTNSASGDVSIGVTAGTGVWLDLSTVSGTTRSDLTMNDAPSDAGANLTLQVRTVSGDIEVHRVSLPAAA
jgi:Putative adhesin